MARGRVFTPTVAAAQSWATRFHTFAYRASGGRVGGRLLGCPVLLLITKGRRSGRETTTPLLYLVDGGNIVVVASNGGAASHPDWWLNLTANPEADVEISRKKMQVRAEEVEGAEKHRLWKRLVEMYPSYAAYQSKTDREIPVIVLHPAG
ncbi:MAG TPA: nitroreductase family deazaflavin-dependent oxidoreductase [Rubrobacteraceae bacterium]|nr:nitroreductase family deazaflavin-dependent oxidoreductase [Rubrobacteraceae bacterium]